MAVINLPIWPQDVWNAEYYINQAPPIPILPEEEEGEAGPSNASIASTVPKIKGQRHLLYTIIDCNVEEVAEIVESGVSLDIDDGMGQGPLHWAVQTRCIEMARLLIDHGVDLNAGLPRFDTPPIHCAILVDDYDMTKLLIDHGCDLETVDSAGRTPLSFAASLDSVNIARLLLDSGANMKAKDKKHKMTPLHWAAECDAPKVAALLLERGASVWATDRNTKTPKMIAIMGRKKKVQEVFAAHSRSSKPKSIAP